MTEITQYIAALLEMTSLAGYTTFQKYLDSFWKLLLLLLLLKNTAYLGISFHIISNNVVEMETLLTSHNSSEM